jgi:AcrR family transcriptional regulator
VRALYEGSAVPVREIAKLAGVSERTLYKYVARYGWRKRYRENPRGLAAAAANRGRRVKPSPGFAPAKGAGGRFIRREDKGQPFAAGLKALDAAGERRAAAACASAQRLARIAEAEAHVQRWGEAMPRAIRAVVQARDDLAAHDAAQKGRQAWSRPAELRERALLLSLKLALDWMKMAVTQWEKAAMASLSPAA